MTFWLPGLIPLAATSFSSDFQALDLVRRAIESDAKTNYTCIRLLNSWGGREPVRVRRDQDKSGKNRVFVLAPLSQQGYTIVDDGKQWVRYDPDAQVVRVQDSPLARVSAADERRRFELLKRNYDVTKEDVTKVAGRETVQVFLKPEAGKELFSRRYWIDRQKFVLLRVEWVHPSGQRQMMSDTLSIEYPDSIPEATFAAKFVGKPRQILIQAPVRQNNIGLLSKSVGFRVVNPIRMPFGFSYNSGDIIRSRERVMALLRYTDGATNVAVYQFPARGRISRPREQERTLFALEGVFISIDGDIPLVGREQIASSFRESSSEREAELRSRVVSLFKATQSSVGGLRDAGLTFDAVVACVVAAKEGRGGLAAAQKAVQAGHGMGGLAKAMGVKSSLLKGAVERFWDMRE